MAKVHTSFTQVEVQILVFKNTLFMNIAVISCDKTRSMAASASAIADAPQLVDNKDARNNILKYFGYISDSEGKPIWTPRGVLD